MNIITKWIRTDTGHRVPLHESKCRSWHGHDYGFTAELTGDLFVSGSQTGMVLDFSFLKELMNENIHDKIDHAMIISTQDQKFFHMSYDNQLTRHILIEWVKEIEATVEANTFWSGMTTFGKTYFIKEFPTAENLARHFFDILEPKVAARTNGQAHLSAMTVDETPTSKAIYRP